MENLISHHGVMNLVQVGREKWANVDGGWHHLRDVIGAPASVRMIDSSLLRRPA